MAKSVKKKSDEEASSTFQNKPKTSVGKSLYYVTFDSNNNPVNAKYVQPMSGKGHGLAGWDSKTFYTKWVYVESKDKNEALIMAKEIANKRVERKS